MSSVLKVLGLLVITLIIAVTLIAWNGNGNLSAAQANETSATLQQTTLNQLRTSNSSSQLVLTNDGQAQMRVASQPLDPYALRAAEIKPSFFETLNPLTASFVGLGVFYSLAFGGLLVVIFARKPLRRAR